MPQEQGVRVNDLVKRFGGLIAVDHVSLDVPAGAFFSLLGPSGCGKSTLLRLIAGLEEPDSGRVWIGSEDVTDTRPQRRPSAMVFQNYALFPHMTVGQNVGYGLRVRRVDSRIMATRVSEALRRVGLEGLEDRPVVKLSGGQQQRVALARAIAVEPGVLLFDEPLSNLDVSLREQTRRELKWQQAELGITSIYVTHDQEEALALSDELAVMNHGRLIESGKPEVLWARPRTAFVARFFGFNVIEHATLVGMLARGSSRPPGASLAVRPEHLSPATEDDPFGIPVQIVSRQFLGTAVEWWVRHEQIPLRMVLDPKIQLGETLRICATFHRWVDLH